MRGRGGRARLAFCKSAWGWRCVRRCSDASPTRSQTANLSAAVGPGEAVAASPLPGGLTDEAATMVAKARALAFADPSANRPEPQIDLAMLATRSNPGATHRLDGPPSPGPTSEALSPDETMARLKALSQASSAKSSKAGEDDRSRDILARLRELSHQPAAATDAAEPQAAPSRSQVARSPCRPRTSCAGCAN